MVTTLIHLIFLAIRTYRPSHSIKSFRSLYKLPLYFLVFQATKGDRIEQTSFFYRGSKTPQTLLPPLISQSMPTSLISLIDLGQVLSNWFFQSREFNQTYLTAPRLFCCCWFLFNDFFINILVTLDYSGKFIWICLMLSLRLFSAQNNRRRVN